MFPEPGNPIDYAAIFGYLPEPPVGSVILDETGRAWQRNGDEWHGAGLEAVACSSRWEDIGVGARIVYRADGER